MWFRGVPTLTNAPLPLWDPCSLALILNVIFVPNHKCAWSLKRHDVKKIWSALCQKSGTFHSPDHRVASTIHRPPGGGIAQLHAMIETRMRRASTRNNNNQLLFIVRTTNYRYLQIKPTTKKIRNKVNRLPATWVGDHQKAKRFFVPELGFWGLRWIPCTGTSRLIRKNTKKIWSTEFQIKCAVYPVRGTSMISDRLWIKREFGCPYSD